MDDAEQQPRRPSGPSASQQQQQQQQSQPQQEQRRRSSVPVPPAFDAPATSASHPTSLDRRPRQGSDSFGEDVLGGASLHHLVQQSPHARLQGNPLNGGNLGQCKSLLLFLFLRGSSHFSTYCSSTTSRPICQLVPFPFPLWPPLTFAFPFLIFHQCPYS